tara:strand:- start:1445 stop:1795 length:351 start_codon:yes stop_codon:yes gene_type:complete
VFDGLLMGMYAFSVLVLGGLVYSHVLLIRSMSKETNALKAKLNDLDPMKGDLFDELHDSLGDLVQSTLASMRTPDASDHLMGGLSQIAQMWAFKKFGNPAEMIQNALTPPVEEENL